MTMQKGRVHTHNALIEEVMEGVGDLVNYMLYDRLEEWASRAANLHNNVISEEGHTCIMCVCGRDFYAIEVDK